MSDTAGPNLDSTPPNPSFVRHDPDCDGHQVLHMVDPIREDGAAGRTLWRPSCICGWQAEYVVTNHGGAAVHTRREHTGKIDQWGPCTGQCCDQDGDE